VTDQRVPPEWLQALVVETDLREFLDVITTLAHQLHDGPPRPDALRSIRFE